MGTDELDSPGCQAIDDAMARLYGDATPVHVGYEPAAAFSSNLQGCSAYTADGHWHYVTYGLSELYLPEPGHDRTVSKWGFEFSFRLAAGGRSRRPSGRSEC